MNSDQPAFWIRQCSLATGGGGCDGFLVVAPTAAGRQFSGLTMYSNKTRRGGLDVRSQSISDSGSWPS